MLAVPAIHLRLCYVRRLDSNRLKRSFNVLSILARVCHEISSSVTFAIALTLLCAHVLPAQVAPPPAVVPAPSPVPGALNGLIRPEAPPLGYWDLYALHKEVDG